MTGNIDNVASSLSHLAMIGKAMPPSWDGAGIAHLVQTSEGIHLGKIMPGRGLYLDCDLKYLGITRPIPNVYEKTKVRRLFDFCKNERLAVGAAGLLMAASLFSRSHLSILGSGILGAIQTYDGIINARANSLAFDVVFSKNSITTVANVWFSLLSVGGNPTSFTFTNIPGGSAPDSTNAAGLLLGVSNPTGGNKAYLQTFGYTNTSGLNTALLADVLVAAGNISATVTTSQTVNTTALTRYTTGAGVQLIFEVTTALGAVAANLTTTYTNQAGTASQSTGAQAMTTSAIAQRLQPGAIVPFTPLATGDYGVQSVQSVLFSGSMTSGAIALELYFPLTFVPGLSANVWAERDMAIQFSGLKELVQTGSNTLGCLALYVFASTTTSGVMQGMIRTCQG